MVEEWAENARVALVLLSCEGELHWHNRAAGDLLAAEGTLALDPAWVERACDPQGDVRFTGHHQGKDLQITVDRVERRGERCACLSIEEIRPDPMEQELLHLASFPELAPHPVFEVDADGDVVYANEHGMGLLDRVDLSALLARIPPGVESHVFEMDVEADRFALTIQHLPDHGCHRVYAQDITEIERTRETAALATQASAAKSAFLANMSHELRTPLNAIIGYGELLFEEAEDPGTLHDLTRLNGAAQHLLTMISGILDLSKIEAGQLQLQWEQAAPVGLIEEVLHAGGGLAEKNGNELRVTVPPDLPPVRCDRAKLRQILINLLGNAAKFTRDGTIDIRARREGDAVLFEVEDSGIGIEPERLEAVFRPFTQAAADTTATYGGTGLGLAISLSLTEAMGGSLQVRSHPGEGSCFTVRIPIAGA